MAKNKFQVDVTVPGAKQARQDLDNLGTSGRRAGEKVSQGGRSAGKGLTELHQKARQSEGLFDRLAAGVLRWATALLSLAGAQRVLDTLIRKLERARDLQREIYSAGLSYQDVGQALEFQTGTVGQQARWADEALKLQRAGGLPHVGVAQQMMISADIAMAAQGGIKNPQVLALLRSLSPFIGAARFESGQVASLFDLASTIGVEPTESSYKDFFAKFQAAYTSSKATDPGAFIQGAQKGVTAYVTSGGTWQEGLALFAGTRAVTASEPLAGTMLEQIARLSSGAYPAPRKAIEEGLGVNWADLTMDQRTGALIRYAGSIPESLRLQTLAEQGFPVELTSQIGKFLSPSGQDTVAQTRQRVNAADRSIVDDQMRAYMESDAAKQRQTEATVAMDKLHQGPEFAAWQRRLQEARSEFEALAATGSDSWRVPDELEPYHIALDRILQEALRLQKQAATEEQQQAARQVVIRAGMIKARMEDAAGVLYPEGLAAAQAYEVSQDLDRIVIHNHYGNTYNPRAGSDPVGPRTDPEAF